MSDQHRSKQLFPYELAQEFKEDLINAYRNYYRYQNNLKLASKAESGIYRQIEIDAPKMIGSTLAYSTLNSMFNDNTHSRQFRKHSIAAIQMMLAEYQERTISFNDFDNFEDLIVTGTTLINKEFCQKVTNSNLYSPSEFYTAKHNDTSQWFGILSDYDIPRNEYKKVRNILEESFNQERTYKVSAVIHGNGGAGKSTLLRRLAVDLSNKHFDVLWVNERQFSDFSQKGLKQIELNEQKDFLVIIEDWYRLINSSGIDPKDIRAFFSHTRQVKNIRIIIGDRQINDKTYLYELYNPDSLIGLGTGDNRRIIKAILEKNQEWKPTARKIFKRRKSYRSTLFLLLFALARSFEESKTDLSEPSTAFRDIIRSDLNKIDKQYPGLAKMLFFWSSIYAKDKFFISYSCFLKLADHFNTERNIAQSFFNIDGDSDIHRILRLYINVDLDETIKSKRFQDIQFIQFNHDVLADQGLSQLKAQYLGEFNDAIKRAMITELLPIKDEGYSSERLLGHFLAFEPQIFMNTEEKEGLMTKFSNHSNRTGITSIRMLRLQHQGELLLEERKKNQLN